MNLLCAVRTDDCEDDDTTVVLPDMKIKEETLKFLSKYSMSLTGQAKNDAFFLGVGFHKPHVPFHIPAAYLEMHDLEKFHQCT